MVNTKEKEHWYHNELVVCGGLISGVFGLTFLLLKLGIDVKICAIIAGSILFGLILLPLADPIIDFIKWIKKQKTNTQESQS